MKTVHFFALVFTALALVPSGAHFFELPGKIGLSQADYFVVQDIYRGWALFGIVLIGAILANSLLAALRWRHGGRPVLPGSAFLLVAATLVIFFTWTYPANQATQNWTVVPENWQALRSQWEYAHATNAVLTFLAFCALVVDALIPERRGGLTSGAA